MECTAAGLPSWSCSSSVRMPCSIPGEPSVIVAACSPSTPRSRPEGSTPNILTDSSSRKPVNSPSAFDPPPTHATSASGRRFSFSRIWRLASRPTIDWKSRTIDG